MTTFATWTDRLPAGKQLQLKGECRSLAQDAWDAGQRAVVQAIELRAQVERRNGRSEVADAASSSTTA